MADLVRDGDELVVDLSGIEKAEAVHGDVRVPITAVQRVEVVDDIVHQVHGLRAPGTGWRLDDPEATKVRLGIA